MTSSPAPRGDPADGDRLVIGIGLVGLVIVVVGLFVLSHGESNTPETPDTATVLTTDSSSQEG